MPVVSGHVADQTQPGLTSRIARYCLESSEYRGLTTFWINNAVYSEAVLECCADGEFMGRARPLGDCEREGTNLPLN